MVKLQPSKLAMRVRFPSPAQEKAEADKGWSVCCGFEGRVREPTKWVGEVVPQREARRDSLLPLRKKLRLIKGGAFVVGSKAESGNPRSGWTRSS